MLDWLLTSAAGVGTIVVGLAHRRKTRPENLPSNPTRRKLLDKIGRTPGVNLRELCQRLGLAKGTARYHLYMLEQAGALGSLERGREHYYFPRGTDPSDFEALATLRRGRSWEFLMAVLDHPGIPQVEVARRLGVSRKKVRRMSEQLERLGFIEMERSRNSCTYTPTDRLAREALYRQGHEDPGARARPLESGNP